MRSQWIAVGVNAALLLVVAALAAAFGTESISLVRALSDPQSLDQTILLHVRLPRIALASIAGAGLASVGVTFQAMLRNPLAEPYVLGVSGGAALGATVVIALGASTLALWTTALISLSAMSGGIAATALVYFIARAGAVASGSSILLAGIIVNAIAGALITFIKTLVTASKSQELLFWLMGFIDVPSATTLLVLVLLVAIGVSVLWLDAGRMNLLSLGDDSARHLGVDVTALERRLHVASSLVVGAIVSVTGLIGFVGLVVPHALRRLVGPDHRVLLPASALAGGATLVLCDLLARAAFRWIGTEPPVGAVTALVGGPLFLVLLRRRTAW
ncbi:MAG: iron ABC transporter permease [Polyangiaceae bacterium]|jgi:iron complex transport system permease protein|nr:iron ABC transporter permease [Polyangiaceae bacterium]